MHGAAVKKKKKSSYKLVIDYMCACVSFGVLTATLLKIQEFCTVLFNLWYVEGHLLGDQTIWEL